MRELRRRARRRPALLPVLRAARARPCGSRSSTCSRPSPPGRPAPPPCRGGRCRAAIEIGPGGYATVPAGRGERLAAPLLGAARAAVGAAAVPDRRPAPRPLGDPGQGLPGPQIVEDRRPRLPRRCGRAAGASTAASPTPASTHGRAPPNRAPRKKPKNGGSGEGNESRKSAAAGTRQSDPHAARKNSSTSTGKKHEEEVNALGAQPIETG